MTPGTTGMADGNPVGQLYVAGIGASAGGLEAMLALFAHLPPTGGVAYVVAQHMARDGHDELVVRLLNRKSTLPVLMARDGECLLPDTVYVIPSGWDGAVHGSTLHLLAPLPDTLSTPSVNRLLLSIAEARGRRAIGIILSGTGSDGVAGCRGLKSQGGMTLAQEPGEAKFNGMPAALIAARLADRVLPVEEMGMALAALFPISAPSPPRVPSPPRIPSSPLSAPPLSAPPLATTPPPAKGLPPPGSGQPPDPPPPELGQLLALVHRTTGLDFSNYKEETLLRRLEKRQEVVGTATIGEYLALARRQPEELKALQEMFLVSVSSFFRDRASFDRLGNTLGARLAVKPEGEPIRVWVAGCASGEEPYTLAMVLLELLEGRHHPIQITGTDLNPQALALARAGIYRQPAFKEMEPALRERYFVGHEEGFAVGAALREAVRFEQRDVLTGPPHPQLDLISCRNLLIYLKSNLQEQLVSSFHRALLPGGLLFIGQSESLGVTGQALFAPVDHYHRLFRRR